MTTPAPPPASSAPEAEPAPAPAKSYADQLSGLETRRRAADLILLRKMANPKDATPWSR